MEILLLPILLCSLVGLYLVSSRPHIINKVLYWKIPTGYQAAIFFLVMFATITIIWNLNPNPTVYHLVPTPGMWIGDLG